MPVPYEKTQAIADESRFIYLGPLTVPSFPDDPHRTEYSRCGRNSAERLVTSLSAAPAGPALVRPRDGRSVSSKNSSSSTYSVEPEAEQTAVISGICEPGRHDVGLSIESPVALGLNKVDEV